MAAKNNPVRRLNPFVLPSETDTQFLLLIAASAILLIGIGYILSLPLILPAGSALGVIVDEVSNGGPHTLDQDVPVEAPEQRSEEILAFTVRFIVGALSPFLILAIGLLVSYLLYRLYPRIVLGRRQIRYDVAALDRRLCDTCDDLAAQVGVLPQPRIGVDIENRSTASQVFGTGNGFILPMGKGMRLLLRKRPDDFEAILFHELAHIVNGDVVRTYFAQALWYVILTLLLVTMVSAIVISSFAASPGDVKEFLFARPMDSLQSPLWVAYSLGLSLNGIFIWLWLPLVAGMIAVRARLLRSREVYADWRAATWGAGEHLISLLGRPSSRKIHRWRWIWNLHPSRQSRLATLRNPSILFQPSPAVSLIVGFLSSYVLIGVLILYFGTNFTLFVFEDIINTSAITSTLGVSEFAAAMTANLLKADFLSNVMLMVAFGLCYVVTNTLGIEVQRQALVYLAGGRSETRQLVLLWKPSLIFAGSSALSFALIWAIGTMALAPSGAFNIVMSSIGGLVSFFMVIAVSTWLSLVYIQHFTTQHFLTHQGPLTPRAESHEIRISAAVTLLAMFVPFLFGSGVDADLFVWGLGRGFLALLIYLLSFGIASVLFRLRRGRSSTGCLYCARPAPRNVVAEPNCRYCGQYLGRWAFVEINETVEQRHWRLMKQHLAKAYVFHDLGRKRKALEEIDLALDYVWGDAEAHRLRGKILEDLSRLDEASLAYRCAFEIDPEQVETRLALVDLELRTNHSQDLNIAKRLEKARILYDLHRFEDGLAETEVVLNTVPANLTRRNVELYFLRGQLREALHHYPDANVSYRKVLELDPEHEGANQRYRDRFPLSRTSQPDPPARSAPVTREQGLGPVAIALSIVGPLLGLLFSFFWLPILAIGLVALLSGVLVYNALSERGRSMLVSISLQIGILLVALIVVAMLPQYALPASVLLVLIAYLGPVVWLFLAPGFDSAAVTILIQSAVLLRSVNVIMSVGLGEGIVPLLYAIAIIVATVFGYHRLYMFDYYRLRERRRGRKISSGELK